MSHQDPRIHWTEPKPGIPRRWGGNEGQTPASPFTFWQINDETGGIWMNMSVSFTAGLVLLSGTTFRADDCPFTKIYLGSLNTDGTPKAGTRTVTVPLGTRTFTAVQLNAVGLTMLSDILGAPQITADW